MRYCKQYNDNLVKLVKCPKGPTIKIGIGFKETWQGLFLRINGLGFARVITCSLAVVFKKPLHTWQS
jgi:hypothetical protein